MDHTLLTIIGIGIQTLLFLAGGWAMVIRNDWSNKTLTEDIRGIQEELKYLAKIVTEVAVQSTRIDNLSERIILIDRRVEDLRRGNGWIVKGRRTIEGEYPAIEEP